MRSIWVYFSLAAVSGLAVAATLLFLRFKGLLLGPWSYLLFALLVISIPLSRSVSRRIFLSGAVLLTWSVIPWWVNLGSGLDRAGWLLALGYGGLTYWLLSSPKIRSRAAQLVPRLRGVDLIPVAAGVAATWVVWPLLNSADNNRSLSLLIKSGWDHVAHFNMVDLIAARGSLIGSISTAPDGSAWANSSYPKHFHALVNVVAEIGQGPFANGHVPTPLQYGQSLCLIIITMLVVLAAGMVQVPAIQRRPLVAWPLVALPISAFLLGPGSVAISAGYPNFVLGCATTAMVGCVAVTMPRVMVPLQLAVLVGLIVSTAHLWLLLVPIAAAAGVVALIPLRRNRWRASRSRSAVAVAIVSAGLVGIGAAVVITIPVLNGATLVAGSSEPFPSASIALALLASTALGLSVVALNGRTRPTGSALRGGWLVLVPIVSVLLLLVLGVRQVMTAHALLYYFGKLGTGVMLILLVLAPLMAVSMPAGFLLARRRHTGWGIAISALFTASAVQMFGYIGPTFGGVIGGQADGLTYRAAERAVVQNDTDEAHRLIQAAKVAAEHTGTTYLAGMAGDPLPFLANQWHFSLSGTWTARAEQDSKELGSLASGQDLAAGRFGAVAERILRSGPTAKVIVAPELMKKISGELPESLRDRLITW